MILSANLKNILKILVVLIILFDQPKGEELDLIIILTFKSLHNINA